MCHDASLLQPVQQEPREICCLNLKVVSWREMTYSWRAVRAIGIRVTLGGGASHRGHLKTILTCCTVRYAQPEASPVEQERCVQKSAAVLAVRPPRGPVNAEASG